MMLRLRGTRAVCAISLIFLILLAGSVPAALAGKVFMWKVRSSQAGPTVWLLGSVHMADASMYPLDARITRAFASCRALAVEADISDPGAALRLTTFLASGIYPAGDSLDRHISARTRAKMTELGLKLDEYQQMRPWLLSLELSNRRLQEMGYDPALGLDLHFLNEAKSKGVRVIELEGVESQLGLLSDLSSWNEDLFLYYTLIEYGQIDRLARELFQSWRQGDAEAMNRLLLRDLKGDPSLRHLYESLFLKRNQGMAVKIAGFFNQGQDVFVVVGAGHLVGEDGLVRLLQARGYSAEQQ